MGMPTEREMMMIPGGGGGGSGGMMLTEEGFLRFLLGPHNLPIRKDLYEPNEDQMNKPLR
jgi:hypothetical protein